MDTFPFDTIAIWVLVWGVPILIVGYVLGALHNIHTGVTSMANDLRALRVLAEKRAAAEAAETTGQ